MNEEEQLRDEERKKDEMNFANQKAGFIAGIIVIITILNDIADIFGEITYLLNIIEFIVCGILAFFILGTRKFDSLLKKEGVEKFGGFLTIVSILLFLLEKILIGNPYGVDKESAIAFIIIAIELVVGAIYLLLSKYPNQNKKFNKTEKFREISYQVCIENKKNIENPYKIAYKKVNEFVNNDYDKLMWLMAESNLSSYDTILNVALKFGLALVTVMAFLGSLISEYSEYDNGIFILQMVCFGIVIFLVCIIISAHSRYKYNGLGDKYVKQAIDSMEKDMVQNKYKNK